MDKLRVSPPNEQQIQQINYITRLSQAQLNLLCEMMNNTNKCKEISSQSANDKYNRVD